MKLSVVLVWPWHTLQCRNQFSFSLYLIGLLYPSQPLKPTKAENPHLNTASVHSLSRCHPASSDHTPLTRCHPVSSDYTPHPVPSDTPPPSSSTSLIREIWEDRLEREAKGGGGGRGGRGRGGGRGRKGGGGEEGETTFRSRSFDGQSFPSGHDQLSVAAVMATTPRSDPIGEPERAGHKNRTLDGSVKWTSLTFPSFAVCSLSNTAPGKPSMAGRGRGGRTRKKDGGGHGHHAPSLPNHHSRSMPFISPKTSSADFDSLLLRRQSMVAFRGGLQPGFRYETLCLQDNDTVTSSTGPAISDPLTIAGPWITTHWWWQEAGGGVCWPTGLSLFAGPGQDTGFLFSGNLSVTSFIYKIIMQILHIIYTIIMVVIKQSWR